MNNKQIDFESLVREHTQGVVSNIDDSIFDEKRFFRFVEKTQKVIWDKYIMKKFPITAKNNVYFADLEKRNNIKDMTEFIIFLWQTYSNPYLTDEELEDHPISEMLRDYRVPDPDRKKQMDEELKTQELMYIMFPFAPLHDVDPDNDNVFAIMVESETCFACKKYIKQKAQVNYNIANDNYFICIPNNFEDCQRIFEDVINGISISLGNFFSSVYAQTISNYVTDDIKTMLQTKYEDNQKVLDDLTNTIKDKDKEIMELRSTISSLKNQLSMQVKSIDEQHKSILEHNNALQRKINKLEKLNAALKSKQTEIDNGQEISLEDVDEVTMEIDCNCKYVFVGFDKNGFQEQVLKHFPNAIFVDSNVNLISADMVIMLTNHITHPVYYGMKEQCKNKQIPFIHCKHSNIELIKELIWNHIND